MGYVMGTKITLESKPDSQKWSWLCQGTQSFILRYVQTIPKWRCSTFRMKTRGRIVLGGDIFGRGFGVGGFCLYFNYAWLSSVTFCSQLLCSFLPVLSLNLKRSDWTIWEGNLAVGGVSAATGLSENFCSGNMKQPLLILYCAFERDGNEKKVHMDFDTFIPSPHPHFGRSEACLKDASTCN